MKKRWLGLTKNQWLVILVLLPGIPFLTASFFIVVYANLPWPLENTIDHNQINSNAKELIVLVHGKGDTADSWAIKFADELNAEHLTSDQQILALDWREYSKDMFRCSLNGRRTGHNLAGKILANSDIRSLHLIGHSAGSFVVYGMCEEIKKNGNQMKVHTTYLDPVSIYGGIDWQFGSRNFGSCADISDAYIDTEDEVPGSNKPLKHPHTFDVTALKPQSSNINPHLWPIMYYRQAVLDQQLPLWEPDESILKQYPPGEHTVY